VLKLNGRSKSEKEKRKGDYLMGGRQEISGREVTASESRKKGGANSGEGENRKNLRGNPRTLKKQWGEKVEPAFHEREGPHPVFKRRVNTFGG